MKLATALAVTLSFAALPALAGDDCPYSSNTTTADKSTPQAISIDTLASVVTAKDTKARAQYAVYDANSPETRTEYGVIPGATMLSHYSDYNAKKELPADKDASLVFYCSSQRCSAAPVAAEKAINSGYSKVYVLKDGIKGWSKAGQPTAKKKSSI